MPIPGSPPMRTSEPGTTPPPRTRSSSATPEWMRAAPSTDTAARGTGAAAGAAPRPEGARRPPPAPAGDARPLLDDRVELAAVGAAAVPLARLEAAGLAAVDGHGPHGRGVPAPGRRRGARRGRPPADRRADEGAQEETPLGALQERGEVLVDGRVLDQAAERALAPLDPPRDGAEVGHRLAQVGQRLAELRVPAESLGELTEARQRLRRLLDALLSAGLRERPEHALAPGDAAR